MTKKAKLKFPVTDSYYSILTRGPLANRPTYFIELDREGILTNMKKLGKKINKECASHMINISGNQVYNEILLTWCLDNHFMVVFNVDSSLIVPDEFDFSLLREKAVFGSVYVDSEYIHETLAKRAFSFNYNISEDTILAKDGLPEGLYRSPDMRNITLTPATTKATAKVIQICKYYGYYLDIPYKNFIGIR